MTSRLSLRSASFWPASRDGYEVAQLRRSRAWRCEPAPLWSEHCNDCGQSVPIPLPSRIDHRSATRPEPPERGNARTWRCGTRQRGETSHPGGWKSPRTPSETALPSADAEWPVPRIARLERRAIRCSGEARQVLPGLAAALVQCGWR